MKNHWRFSLATLLLSVTGVAVVCAVLPDPHAAFYALLTVFFFAAILARFGPTNARGFWFWFSLCGWVYVVLGVSLLEGVEATAFWRSTREWLQKNSPAPYNWTPEDYLMFAHSLFAMCVAFTGAILFPFLRGIYRPYSTNGISNGAPTVEPEASQ